ncbi:MAG: hypothetical protein ACI4DS_05260 [Eubacterium sp.]
MSFRKRNKKKATFEGIECKGINNLKDYEVLREKIEEKYYINKKFECKKYNELRIKAYKEYNYWVSKKEHHSAFNFPNIVAFISMFSAFIFSVSSCELLDLKINNSQITEEFIILVLMIIFICYLIYRSNKVDIVYSEIVIFYDTIIKIIEHSGEQENEQFRRNNG